MMRRAFWQRQEGFFLAEVMVAVAVVGMLVAAMISMTELGRTSQEVDQVTYGHALASAVAVRLQQTPYRVYPDPTGYTVLVPEAENPRQWTWDVSVDNHQSGAVPEWDPAYPDSGLQRIWVRVRDLSGRERAEVALLKHAE